MVELASYGVECRGRGCLRGIGVTHCRVVEEVGDVGGGVIKNKLGLGFKEDVETSSPISHHLCQLQLI